MKKIFNVAVIGCGAISQTHINCINEIKQCRLVAVCDIDERLVSKTAKLYGCKCVIDYKELLLSNDIDAVHILTPHYLHVPMAIKALKAGKHVVLEKPVGICFDELMKLYKASKTSNVQIGVSLQNRYNPTSIKMKELAESKTLGELIASKGIIAWHRTPRYYKNSDWRGSLEKEGGGLLINQAIHTLDLLRWIGGNVNHLKGHIANHYHPMIEVEDTALASLYYEDGGVANFYGTNNHGTNSNIELEFVFEKGILSFNNNKLFLTKNNESILLEDDAVVDGEKSYWGISHKKCIQEYYDAISDNKNPPIALVDAMITNEIVLGIYESSKTNQEYKMSKGKLYE